jgi:hypothetical protein
MAIGFAPVTFSYAEKQIKILTLRKTSAEIYMSQSVSLSSYAQNQIEFESPAKWNNNSAGGF